MDAIMYCLRRFLLGCSFQRLNDLNQEIVAMKKNANANRTGLILGLLLSLSIMTPLVGCGSKPSQSVSGQVTAGGSAFSSVTMTLSGPSVNTMTTDAGGNYFFNDVEEGTYTLTPAFTGYTFTPASRAVFIFGMNATAFNFDGGLDNRIATTTHTVYAKRDGTLWAWGKNDDGQLGDGTTASRSTPVKITGVSNVKAVAAGYDHTVVLTTDGKVYTWGNNSNGQLGDGSTTGRTTPAQVGGADISNIKAIDAGYKYTIALGSDGTVWTWGYNNKGQLGNNTQTDSYTPQQVGTLSGSVIASIAAGYDHALSARNDGTVWAWGNNSSGQLGNNTLTDSLVPVQVSGLITVQYVAAGNLYSLALLNDGSVRAWGHNALGELGDGTATDRVTPVAVINLASTAGIVAGYDHAIARLTNGTVWTWGNNSNGQLGDNSTTARTNPQQVSTLSGAVAVSAGQNDTLALLKADEAFRSWGRNFYGQLGDGTMTERWLPVPIQVQ
jgi:alpha-tubulin suppressor-like RCC1 family protein